MSNKARSCVRSRSCEKKHSNRLHRQICIGMELEEYNCIWQDAKKVRELVDRQMLESPELFPYVAMTAGSKCFLGIILTQGAVINKKVYHDHWLHNLNISASLAGFRSGCT